MKKGLILTTALAMALGMGVAVGAHQGAKVAKAVSAGETVYLKPGVWAADGAWFAMYTFDGSAGETWTKMTQVEGDTDYYSATVPENSPSVIFTRMDPAKTSLDWNSKWNQSADLSFPADKNLYTVTGWNQGDGSWGTYEEPEPPEPIDENYYLKGAFNDWTSSEDYKFTVDSEDPNKYVLEDVEIEAGQAMKGFQEPNNWYGVDHAYDDCGWTVGDGGNCVVTEAGTYDVTLYVNSEDGNHLTIKNKAEPQPPVDPDVPAEDGYYIVGTESNWTYTGATKMSAGDDEDLAKLIGYEAKANEVFKVRSYLEKQDVWYGENYEVGEAARTLDIFLNQYGQVYVFDHEEPEPPVEADYYLKGDFNEWKVDEDYKFTVDSEDPNKYVLADVEIEAGQGMKGFKAEDNWYGVDHAYEGCGWTVGTGEHAGDCVVTESGTYEVTLYVNSEDGNHLAIKNNVPPQPESVYKYSLNGAEAVAMTQSTEPGKESEYLSSELSFKKGDELTFTKDDAAYAVEPKEDGAFTKVYKSESKLVFAEDYEGALYLETNGGYLWAGQFSAGYYLFGTFNGWNAKLGVKAELEGGVGPAYVVEGLALDKDDEIEMISFPAEGKDLSYYEADPNKVGTMSEADFTVITGDVPEKGNIHFNKASTYTIYFNPSDGYYGIEDDNYVAPVYTVQVGSTVYDLELNEGTEYKIKDHIDIKLTAGEEIKVLKDDVEQEFARKKIGNNNLDEDFKVIANGQGQVYIDLEAKTIFAQGLDFGGYHVLHNGEYVHMTQNPDPMDPSFLEYYTGMISFKEGEVVRFIDTSAVEGAGYAVVFDITKISEASAEGFAVEEGHLVAQKDVNLSVYLKLKMDADEVYFGEVSEEVALAKEFAEEFNDAIGAVCTWDNKTNLEALRTAWQAQVTKFGLLVEKAQEVLKKATSEHDITEIAQFIAKYEYVAGRYGDQLGEGYNFLAKDIKASAYYGGLEVGATDNSTMIIIISIAAASALALGALILIKKRKHN